MKSLDTTTNFFFLILSTFWNNSKACKTINKTMLSSVRYITVTFSEVELHEVYVCKSKINLWYK